MCRQMTSKSERILTKIEKAHLGPQVIVERWDQIQCHIAWSRWSSVGSVGREGIDTFLELSTDISVSWDAKPGYILTMELIRTSEW